MANFSPQNSPTAPTLSQGKFHNNTRIHTPGLRVWPQGLSNITSDMLPTPTLFQLHWPPHSSQIPECVCTETFATTAPSTKSTSPNFHKIHSSVQQLSAHELLLFRQVWIKSYHHSNLLQLLTLPLSSFVSSYHPVTLRKVLVNSHKDSSEVNTLNIS